MSSAYTLLVANASFLSDELSVLGLRISVSQHDLIAAGRFVIVMLLLIFLAHASILLLKRYETQAGRAYKTWEESSLKEIAKIEEHMENRYGGDPNEDWRDAADPWDVHHYEEDQKKLARLHRITICNAMLGSGVDFSIRYALTILVSLIALFRPEVAGAALKLFALRLGPESNTNLRERICRPNFWGNQSTLGREENLRFHTRWELTNRFRFATTLNDEI
ncbi:hypothetical protein [Boseongicola aestuarii]|uniref:Uncharacterized protein n=1 Tax=Boseongicola aestuarii TaxID=1470561 RepID=A0A238IW03_9RHOB|nr:hypothetical protein [Boseongicola aestuarii]SMX22597.1 hypothetical protein BOA8489_00695 [Boseongicola aestuarii]